MENETPYIASPVTGRAAGGRARAENLSPDRRREIASEGAKARWSKINEGGPMLKAKYPGEVQIGGIIIPCAVLSDGTRVLSENGITNALLGSRSGASKRLKKSSEDRGAPVPLFLAPSQLKPFITQDLIDGPLKRIEYLQGRRIVAGYDARILPTVCDIWLKARAEGALQEQQEDKAAQAEILARGLMHVGIVALVDEATGYQGERGEDALQRMLDAYLRKELAAWAKRFPDEFYRQIFRLRGWAWKGRTSNPPQVVAQYTKDIVYSRLAPAILTELEKRNPIENGRRRNKHHQFLTDDVGHPALAQHIYAVITLMRIAPNWPQFIQHLDLAHPRRGDTLMLPYMDDGNEKGNGNEDQPAD